MTHLTLHLEGMGCRECVREVTARLRDVPGVQTVTADHRRSVVLLSGSMKGDDVEAALQRTRFHINAIAADSDQTEGGQSASSPSLP
jgi:copper chaperone CopZ